MDDDQQFCLRWNNHQSTLVTVFETLLENGTLVDCTLAAEGKCLNAHKVVLSACSPYFEALLSKHFDKHPILILKDVKFQELKAMMDYMYRGEVNISQDQLGALLKAAESLQIKGLSDNRKGETERKPAPVPPPPKSPQPTSTLPKVQGLTIEQRSRDDSREGSMSPGPRKKKRLRRKSEELDNHDASNSSESHSLPAQNIPISLPAASKLNADVPEPVETKSEILTRHKQDEIIPQVPIIKEKIETHTELMLEPKSEYVEEMNEDSIEDLTLDDDDLSNMEQVDDQAGPSHGNTGEGSSQGFGGWHMGNQSQDEVFLAAQEAVGAHRDSQGFDVKRELESDSENFSFIPPNVEETTPDLIPENSKDRYNAVYKTFMEWKTKKNISSFSEDDLLTYFIELSKQYKATTLWTFYSMLKTTLIVKHDISIDKYLKLKSFLKSNGDRFQPKKSNILSADEINQFIQIAPDEVYLMLKVALIFGISGSMRRAELCNVRLKHLTDLNTALLVEIPTTHNKIPRSFTIIGHFYDIYKRYASLRPPQLSGGDERFFLNYQKGRCVCQYVGKNKFGSMVKEIAKFLNLPNPESYTGHSFRKSSAHILVDPRGE